MPPKKGRRVVQFDELAASWPVLSHPDGVPHLVYVITAAAFVENALGSLLEKALIKSDVSNDLLNNARGSLSSYSARADVCYCLGLIPKDVYTNARAIGDIRNAFAHSHAAIGFDDPRVVEHCKRLQLPPLGRVVLGSELEDMTPEKAIDGRPPNDYERFAIVFVDTYGAVMCACDDVKPCEPNVPDFAVGLNHGPGLSLSHILWFRE